MKKLLISFVTLSLALLFGGCGDEVTNINGPMDWQGPTVEWQSAMDAEVRGTVGLDVAVLDSSAILRVKLYVDGSEDQTLTAPPYRFELVTDSLLDGVHLCEARAWDQYENLGISPVLRVNVVNSIAQGPRVLWVPDSLATIQAAINAAQDFDTIRVRDGTYYETLNTFGKGIWIESEHGPLRCEINAAGVNNCVYIPGGRELSAVRGFSMVGGVNLAYLGDGSRVNLYNNVFFADSAEGLLITGYSSGRIVNNLFSGSDGGVQVGYHWGEFFNNILQHVRNVAFWNAALYGNPLQYGYDAFWMNGSDYNDRFEPGPGDFHADPLIDLQEGRLLPESPCIDAGNPDILDSDGSRSDIGPFGGPWAY
ncbi:MAG: Ig-like domain-containing protein [bacterium]|nr:Ig-like domain-containing protein [bacterium]